ncbi:hypothetical protein EKD04_021065 [Chloroflexales bacterium ZM16-3]|nr:hypothetical protein [Chloroflexales bacterium ZM16-3]
MTAITTYDEALAVARRLPLPERLRLASALAGEAAGALAAWPPPGVIVRMPTAPLASPPVLRGGTWASDIPLRREDLYDDRGRA